MKYPPYTGSNLKFHFQFGVWAQEDYINQVDYALEKGAAILDHFDNLYGEENKYPLTKMGEKNIAEFIQIPKKTDVNYAEDPNCKVMRKHSLSLKQIFV